MFLTDCSFANTSTTSAHSAPNWSPRLPPVSVMNAGLVHLPSTPRTLNAPRPPRPPPAPPRRAPPAGPAEEEAAAHERRYHRDAVRPLEQRGGDAVLVLGGEFDEHLRGADEPVTAGGRGA